MAAKFLVCNLMQMTLAGRIWKVKQVTSQTSMTSYVFVTKVNIFVYVSVEYIDIIVIML